jgi:hypothetical protein
MHELTLLHVLGFAAYAMVLLAGPVIWLRQGNAALREAERLGVDDML